MTRKMDTPPGKAARRWGAIARVVAGILGSIAGIAVVVFAFVLYLGEGSTPRWNQEAGYLFIAIAGFLVSAAGTDLRRNASGALKS